MSRTDPLGPVFGCPLAPAVTAEVDEADEFWSADVSFGVGVALATSVATPVDWAGADELSSTELVERLEHPATETSITPAIAAWRTTIRNR